MNNVILTQIPVHELVNLIASEVEARIHKSALKEIPQDRIGLKETMEITGLKQSAIYKMTMHNTIPHQKFGKQLVFSRRELEEWMKEKTVRKQSPEDIASEHLAEAARKRINKSI